MLFFHSVPVPAPAGGRASSSWPVPFISSWPGPVCTPHFDVCDGCWPSGWVRAGSRWGQAYQGRRGPGPWTTAWRVLGFILDASPSHWELDISIWFMHQCTSEGFSKQPPHPAQQVGTSGLVSPFIEPERRKKTRGAAHVLAGPPQPSLLPSPGRTGRRSRGARTDQFGLVGNR